MAICVSRSLSSQQAGDSHGASAARTLRTAKTPEFAASRGMTAIIDQQPGHYGQPAKPGLEVQQEERKCRTREVPVTGLAVSFTVSGMHGVLVLLAVICFAIAALVALFVGPVHRYAIGLIAAGLFLWSFSALVSG